MITVRLYSHPFITPFALQSPGANPLRTKLSTEQTDALYREAHATVVEGAVGTGQSQGARAGAPGAMAARRRDRVMPALKK